MSTTSLKKELLVHREKLGKDLQAIMAQISNCDQLLASMGEPVPEKGPKGAKPTNPTAAQMIEYVIGFLPREFTVNEVTSLIMENFPEMERTTEQASSLGTAFWKYAKENLTEIEKGSGRRPSVYSRK